MLVKCLPCSPFKFNLLTFAVVNIHSLTEADGSVMQVLKQQPKYRVIHNLISAT